MTERWPEDEWEKTGRWPEDDRREALIDSPSAKTDHHSQVIIRYRMGMVTSEKMVVIATQLAAL